MVSVSAFDGRSELTLCTDIINITAIISFGFHGRKNDGFTFAQAYWMTCCSTVISTVTNVTLIVDYLRTDRFSQSGSGLTSKQRSLVIIVIILFSWIAAGAGVFSAMLDLSFQDALYFTIVSIESTFLSIRLESNHDVTYYAHCQPLGSAISPLEPPTRGSSRFSTRLSAS